MIITISVVLTCIFLVAINLYVVIRDSYDKKYAASDTFRKLKRLSEELYYIDNDVSEIKRRLEGLENSFVLFKTDPARQIDINLLDKKFNYLESQIDVALSSINTLQLDSLKIFDSAEKM